MTDSIRTTGSLPLLVVLFAGSGAAALIYEIVWFQLLQLAIGSSAISLGVLLGTFMGGMGLGSLLLPRLVSPRHHPLAVYALLELGIALIGIGVLAGLPYAGDLYTAVGGYGPAGIFLRAVFSGVCLLPPTLLMGATLPAIARWVKADPRGVAWLGFFYGGNIAGAVFGCLWAGFYLLRVYDVAIATYAAVAINLSVAAIGYALARIAPYRSGRGASEREAPPAAVPASGAVYLVIALSGLAALGAEVVWTRLLSLLFGASVYAFSIILAVFLLGLGTGSSAGSALARWSTNPRRDLGLCQGLAAAAVAWAAYMLTEQLPYWPIDPTLAPSPWPAFQLDLFRAALAVVPAACLWGASFPLALAAVARGASDTGRAVGRLYAANTVGAILGAVGFTVLFVGWFGTRQAQQALIGFSLAAAALALAPWGWRLPRVLGRAAALVTAAILGAVLTWSVPPTPDGLIGYGRYLAMNLGNRDPLTGEYFVPNILEVAEGMNASVAVSETRDGYRNFHVSGKIEASSDPKDMRLQRMLGHLPALLHPEPRSVLVVGFGAGVTAGTFVNYPSVERIVICEIEPRIPEIVAKYFGEENDRVLEDPRVEMIYDDARHYLLTTDEQFDVITSDPIHPWVKGAATLYTREYIELVRRRLSPDGVVSQWVPLYQSSPEVVKSELATFFGVFPDGTVWANDDSGRGYDIVVVGRSSESPIDVDDLARRLARSDHAAMLESLEQVGFGSVTDLLATYATHSADLAPWLAGAEINRDRNLRLQYLAGLGLNRNDGPAIYEAMLRHRRFPEELFAGSSLSVDELRRAIDRRRPRTLTETQVAAISDTLRAAASRRISITAVAGDTEAYRFAEQLGQAIANGGWRVDRMNQSVFSNLVVGMIISVGAEPAPPAANELFRALREAGLLAPGNLDPNLDPDEVLLMVGERQ